MNFGIPYKQISDDYKIISIFPTKPNGVFDYNSISIFKKLYDKGYLINGTIQNCNGEPKIKDKHIYNGNEFSEVLYSYLAKEYLDSAITLCQYIQQERKGMKENGNMRLSSYVNPCAFLCRHAIELKLKQCLCKQNEQAKSICNSHKLLKLWDKVDKSKLNSQKIKQLTTFISELSDIDPNSESIRYGTDKTLLPIQNICDYDCIALIQNAMYLFNQLHIIAF